MAPKKKVPAFYTEPNDLITYRVKPNDLLITPLGLTAAVLGVNYKRCPEGANIWRDVLKLEKIVQEDAEERALVQELNRQYQEQLAAEEAKKTKKKAPAAADGAAQPATA